MEHINVQSDDVENATLSMKVSTLRFVKSAHVQNLVEKVCRSYPETGHAMSATAVILLEGRIATSAPYLGLKRRNLRKSLLIKIALELVSYFVMIRNRLTEIPVQRMRGRR